MNYAAMYYGTTPIVRGSVGASGAWTRPAEWMTLPAAPTQGMKGLIGISNDDGNYVAIRCSTSSGTYTVNWGDGTSSTGVASGVSAEKLYVYADITNTSTSSTTLTLDGHRQCIVTVTPDTGNLTVININITHSRAGLVAAHRINWLDVNIAGAYLAGTTPIVIGSSSGPVMGYLERVNIGTTGVVTSYASLFHNCTALRSVNLFDTSYCFDFSNWFRNCYVINSIPLFDMSAGCYYVVSKTAAYVTLSKTLGGSAIVMGSNITSGAMVKISNNTVVGGSITSVVGTSNVNVLTSSDSELAVGDYVRFSSLAGGSGFIESKTTLSSAFNGCYSLQSLPLWNLSACTTLVYAFYNNYSLQSVPLWNLSACVTLLHTFDGCYSLQSLPLWNLSACTTLAVAFYNNYSLQSVPLWNLSACVTLFNTFNGCYSLQSLPLWNLSACTTLSYAFQYCYSLQSLPLWNLSACVTLANAFNGCGSLQSVPLWNLSACVTLFNTFNGCSSLQSVPAFTLGYSKRKERAPALTTPNWTLGSGWAYSGTTLVKNAAGTGTATPYATAINLATSAAADDIIDTAADHGYVAGDFVVFPTLTGGAGLTTYNVYRVLASNLLARTFQVEELNADGTFGGSAINFSTDITAGTVKQWDLGIVASTVYKVVIVTTGYSGGNAIGYTLGGVAGTSITADGTTTDYITTSTTAKLILTPTHTDVRATITSISIEEMVVYTDAFRTCSSLADFNPTGITRSFSLDAAKLSRTSLQKVMTNLGTSGPASQTVTLTNNHGTVDLTAGDKAIATAKGWATSPA